MRTPRRMAVIAALTIGATLPLSAGSPAWADPPAISCEIQGLGVTCSVTQTVSGVATSTIVCDATAADISQLPDRVDFNSGTCEVTLTSAMLATTITLTCTGSGGFLETDPATTLQIFNGSCASDVKLLGITIGKITATGQLSTITITGNAVTFQVGGAQFIVSVTGIGVGLSCSISGSVLLNPNNLIPILVHPPLPDC